MNKVKTISRLVSLSLIAVATSGFAITEEDSVHSWGPWTTLVQPAAGPQAPTPTRLAGPVVPGFGAGDASQFTAVVETPTTTTTTPNTETVSNICVGSAVCSYALIYSRPNGRGNQTSLQPATASLSPIPVRPVAVQQPPQGDAPLRVVIASVETSLALNSSTSVPLSIAINNVLVNFQNQTNWQYSANGTTLQGNTVDLSGAAFAYGSSEVINGETTMIGTFVTGNATGLDVLDLVQAGNVEATYDGFSLESGVVVSIDVNFGASTWNGSWNDGNDGRVQFIPGSDGVNVLKGSVGFTALGTINGVNLVSTSVAAQDASSISGTVNGSFFGTRADVIAGAVNINKTTANYTDGNYQDLYVTSRNVNLPRVENVNAPR